MGVPSLALGLFSHIARPWKMDAKASFHAIPGIVLLVLCVLEIVTGFFFRFKQRKGRVPERILQCVKIFHKVIMKNNIRA